MIPDGSPSLLTQYAYDLPLATTLFSTELWVTLQGGLSLHASAAPGHVSSTSSPTSIGEGRRLTQECSTTQGAHFERRVMERSSSFVRQQSDVLARASLLTSGALDCLPIKFRRWWTSANKHGGSTWPIASISSETRRLHGFLGRRHGLVKAFRQLIEM